MVERNTFLGVFGLVILGFLTLAPQSPLSISTSTSNVQAGEPFLIHIDSSNDADTPQALSEDLCYDAGGVNVGEQPQILSPTKYETKDTWSHLRTGSVETSIWVYADSNYVDDIFVSQKCNDGTSDFEEIPLSVSPDSEGPEFTNIDVPNSVDSGESFTVDVRATDPAKIYNMKVTADGDGGAFIGGFQPCGDMYNLDPNRQYCSIQGTADAYTVRDSDGEITLTIQAEDYQNNVNKVTRTVTVNEEIGTVNVYVPVGDQCNYNEYAENDVPSPSFDSLTQCQDYVSDDDDNTKEKVTVYTPTSQGTCTTELVSRDNKPSNSFDSRSACLDRIENDPNEDNPNEDNPNEDNPNEDNPNEGFVNQVIELLFGWL
jgi:hypothetical protein